MNTLSNYIFIGCFFMAHTFSAQNKSLTVEYKETVILEVSRLLNDFYIFPEVAKKNEIELQRQLDSGFYNMYTSSDSFSVALTKQLQRITKDKHLLVRPSLPKMAIEHTIDRVFEDHLNRLSYNQTNHGGYNEVKIFEGNVGYLDLRNFAQPNEGIPYADSYMQLLSATDAIIIDLRQNGGGMPGMVQYLCSYFFSEKIHLNSLYFREGDRTMDFWTQDVKGMQMPDIPLFLIVSNKTFSGAEEFAYNMQTQNRATLIGQTTRGGANPGTIMPLNDRLEIFIPTGMAINPITNTNWEGTGVVPDVVTAEEDSFSKALELAKKAAIEFNGRNAERNNTLIAELIGSIKSFERKTDQEKLFDILKRCKEEGLVEEGMINGVGYEYLKNYKKPIVAEAIFRINTILYPQSANVYDSYAESLMENGKLQAAAESYQKAIDIAIHTHSNDLPYYQENLKKVKGRL